MNHPFLHHKTLLLSLTCLLFSGCSKELHEETSQKETQRFPTLSSPLNLPSTSTSWGAVEEKPDSQSEIQTSPHSLSKSKQEEAPVPVKSIHIPIQNSGKENNTPFLTFSKTLQDVRMHYPELQKQKAKVEGADAEKSMAQSGFFPKLRLSETITRSDDPVKVFMSKLEQQSFQTSDFEVQNLNQPSSWNNFGTVLSLEVPLFDACQTIIASRAANHHLEGARAIESLRFQESGLLASHAYLKAMLSTTLLKNTSRVLILAEMDLKEAEALVQQGVVLGADYYTARSLFLKIQQIHQDRKKMEWNTQISVNILRGKPVDETFSSAEKIPELSHPWKPLDLWIDEAFDNRQDLTATRAALEAAREEVAGEKAKILPRISGFAEGQQNTRDFNGTGENYAVGIKGSIDLFDPVYSARIRAARARLKEVQLEEIRLKDEISRIVAESETHFETVYHNLPLAKQASTDAQTSVELTEKLYREGRKSIADLIGARMTGMEAESSYQELRIEKELSYIRLIFATGQLNTPFLDEMERQLDGEGK